MITGFNHNIKYKNRIFHIQTEDSGERNPHIITHLFVGGNIVATHKADYRHLLSIPDSATLQNAVKNMMEEQHKQMLRHLIHGRYDNATNVENAHHLDGPAPLNVDANVLAATGGSGNKGPSSGSSHSTLPAPSASAVPSAVGGAAASVSAVSAGALAARAPAAAVLQAPAAVPARATPPPGVPIGAGRPVAIAPSQPPPPVVATATPAAPPRPAPAPLDLAAAAASILSGGTARPPAKPAPVDMPTEANLPPEVLAARALKEKPTEVPVTADTIFGEDLISEKSLDEVILSYLADESE